MRVSISAYGNSVAGTRAGRNALQPAMRGSTVLGTAFLSLRSPVAGLSHQSFQPRRPGPPVRRSASAPSSGAQPGRRDTMRAPDTSHQQDTSAPPLQCPFCSSTHVITTSKLVDTATYWRCQGCGQVWNPSRLVRVSRQRTW
jgi:hypothetical protein